MIRHFYHLYADGLWLPPLLEHLVALRSLPPMLTTVGVVGSPANRRKAIAWLDPSWQVEEFDDGHEQRTLDMLFASLMLDEVDGPVLYAHTKGASDPSRLNVDWRRCMTQKLIACPTRALVLLGKGWDTVGCHWLTPEEYPRQVQIPFYGGNFWWASAAHLRRLPAPSHASRWHAESWLGTVRPSSPADLAPGWPGVPCRTH